MKGFAEAIDHAVAAWRKLRSSPATTPTAEPKPTGSTDLHQSVVELEADLAEAEKNIVLMQTRASDLEMRAMEAIRAGDEDTALVVLRELQDSAATVEALDADAAVLRAMIADCRAVLSQVAHEQPGHSAPEQPG